MTLPSLAAVLDRPAVEGTAPLTFAEWLSTGPARDTPAGDLAADLCSDLAAGCLLPLEATPDGIRAHLTEQHAVAPWVLGALDRLIDHYLKETM